MKLSDRGYGTSWKKLRLEILIRDGSRCRWCGGLAETVDLLIPRTLGGSDDQLNLVAACLQCAGVTRTHDHPGGWERTSWSVASLRPRDYPASFISDVTRSNAS